MEPKHNHNGFTLIEILIAIVIMGLVALGIFALLPSGYTQTTNAGRLSIMSHYGQQKMDQLRGLPYNSEPLTNGLHPSTGPEFYDTNYTITWYVSDYTIISPAKSIQVEVGYNIYKPGPPAFNPRPANSGTNQSKYTFRTYVTQE